MSFIFTITLSQDDKLNQDDLKRWHPINTRVKLCLRKPLFSKRGNIISIEEQSWEVAGLLTDNADPDLPCWDMRNELLPEIAQLVKLLRQNTKSGFLLRAYWAGEHPINQIELSIDEMVDTILRGQIGTKTTYLIR